LIRNADDLDKWKHLQENMKRCDVWDTGSDRTLSAEHYVAVCGFRRQCPR
jgi:hypothetical protein